MYFMLIKLQGLMGNEGKSHKSASVSTLLMKLCMRGVQLDHS